MEIEAVEDEKLYRPAITIVTQMLGNSRYDL